MAISRLTARRISRQRGGKLACRSAGRLHPLARRRRASASRRLASGRQSAAPLGVTLRVTPSGWCEPRPPAAAGKTRLNHQHHREARRDDLKRKGGRRLHAVLGRALILRSHSLRNDVNETCQQVIWISVTQSAFELLQFRKENRVVLYLVIGDVIVHAPYTILPHH